MAVAHTFRERSEAKITNGEAKRSAADDMILKLKNF